MFTIRFIRQYGYISQAVGQVGQSAQPERCDKQPVSQEGSQSLRDTGHTLMLSAAPPLTCGISAWER